MARQMKRLCVVLGCVGAVLVGWHAQGLAQGPTQGLAQERPAGYPVRPIRIIVPSAPGGALDMMCRAVGQMLSEKWGQTVVVDNRPGGGTVIATEIAAKAPRDGYKFPAW